MEQQTNKPGSIGENKRGLQLPPLEPQTPAVGAAKRILWVGDDLLQKAEEASNLSKGSLSLDDSRHPVLLKDKALSPKEEEQPVGRPAW